MKEYTLDQAAKDSRKAWEMAQAEEMPEMDLGEEEDFDLLALSDDDGEGWSEDEDGEGEDGEDDHDREYFWSLAGIED